MEGLHWDNGKENGNYSSIIECMYMYIYIYVGYIGVVYGQYRDYLRIMEKKMETTIMERLRFRV